MPEIIRLGDRMDFYTFFRSSAAYRVRIALNLKGIAADEHYVHLRRDGGEQRTPEFLDLNPQALVPVLTDGDLALTQSLAIIEYLDETHPAPPLLPGEPRSRALARSFALAIACDIHPLNNLRVLQYLGKPLGQTNEDRDTWYRHWAEDGLTGLERTEVNAGCAGDFLVGDAPTIADICLVPQIYNAERFASDLGACPTLLAIDRRCRELDAFARAAPERQPDAE